jgi:hypothetical protein
LYVIFVKKATQNILILIISLDWDSETSYTSRIPFNSIAHIILIEPCYLRFWPTLTCAYLVTVKVPLRKLSSGALIHPTCYAMKYVFISKAVISWLSIIQKLRKIHYWETQGFQDGWLLQHLPISYAETLSELQYSLRLFCAFFSPPILSPQRKYQIHGLTPLPDILTLFLFFPHFPPNKLVHM